MSEKTLLKQVRDKAHKKLFCNKEVSRIRAACEEVKKVKKLSEFSLGEHGVIKQVGGDGKIRRRLFDMGVTPGAEVYMRKRAPLGDPIEVTLRGYELTLRKTEAEVVLAEVDE